FFSSRRRHTRFSRDWSSDVCSSDLAGGVMDGRGAIVSAALFAGVNACPATDHPLAQSVAQLFAEHGGRVAEPESPGPGPGLLVDVVEGRAPADFDRHVGPSAAAEGFSSRPRVIVRLTRIRGDGEPRLPPWFDPLGIGGGCPAVKAAVGLAGRGAEPAVLVPTTVDECFAYTR